MPYLISWKLLENIAYVESLKQSSVFVIVFVFVFVCAIVTAKGVELMKMVG